jgi:subtilase family serine protease
MRNTAMRTSLLLTALAATAGLALTGTAAAGPVTPLDGTAAPAAADTAVPACGTPQPGFVRCLAEVLPGARHKASADATPDGATALPKGYGPADLDAAYGLGPAIRAGAGTGETVAIVDGNDDPSAEADLAVYRSTYGLPACTTANGCFRKVNQTGQAAPLPGVDGGWAIEISLDLDAVSAACPSCHILLVESDTASPFDAGIAEDTAVALGAVAVSNSYSIAEGSDVLGLAGHYDHPGVAITAASGDLGYSLAAPFPADLPSVTAVGGTTLTPGRGGRGWTETAWAANAKGDAAGSACSAWVAKPAWQHDRDCPGRTIADISADADPATGYAVYDTTPNPDNLPPGWMVIGGTSASTPFIAGVYALAGPTAIAHGPAGLYAHAGAFHDVVGGNNSFPGASCPDTSYLCTAVRGYDAPTGLGTPNTPTNF